MGKDKTVRLDHSWEEYFDKCLGWATGDGPKASLDDIDRRYHDANQHVRKKVAYMKECFPTLHADRNWYPDMILHPQMFLRRGCLYCANSSLIQQSALALFAKKHVRFAWIYYLGQTQMASLVAFKCCVGDSAVLPSTLDFSSFFDIWISLPRCTTQLSVNVNHENNHLPLEQMDILSKIRTFVF